MFNLRVTLMKPIVIAVASLFALISTHANASFEFQIHDEKNKALSSLYASKYQDYETMKLLNFNDVKSADFELENGQVANMALTAFKKKNGDIALYSALLSLSGNGEMSLHFTTDNKCAPSVNYPRVIFARVSTNGMSGGKNVKMVELCSKDENLETFTPYSDAGRKLVFDMFKKEQIVTVATPTDNYIFYATGFNDALKRSGGNAI